MAIKTECSKCGQSFSAQDSLHFKTVQCPSCGHKTQVVTADEARIAAAAQEREREEEETKRAARAQEKTREKAQHEAQRRADRELHKTEPIITRNNIHLVVAIISTICFLVTIQQPPGLLVVVNYTVLAIAVILWVDFAWNNIASLKKRGKRILTIVCICLIILVFCLYYQVDYYDKRYKSSDRRVEIITYHRGGTPVYCYISIKIPHSEGPVPPPYRDWAEFDSVCRLSFKGPVTPSGMKHGCWEMWSGLTFDLEFTWYWYGEIISEGDWHRFNK